MGTRVHNKFLTPYLFILVNLNMKPLNHIKPHKAAFLMYEMLRVLTSSLATTSPLPSNLEQNQYTQGFLATLNQTIRWRLFRPFLAFHTHTTYTFTDDVAHYEKKLVKQEKRFIKGIYPFGYWYNVVSAHLVTNLDFDEECKEI